MKLVQKKCPNCGAGLNFEENSKKTVCDYCKQTYYIKHDTKVSNVDNKELTSKEFNDSYNLVRHSVSSVAVIIFIIAGLIIFSSIFMIFKIFDDMFSDKNEPIIEEKVPKITEFSQIDSKSLEIYHNESIAMVNGIKGSERDFVLQGDWSNVGMYLLTSKKDDKVCLEDIYKGTYKNNKGLTLDMYVGVTYCGLTLSEDGIVKDDFKGNLEAPFYLLNEYVSGYTYGYLRGYVSNEDYYNKVLRSLVDEYDIKATEGLYLEKAN